MPIPCGAPQEHASRGTQPRDGSNHRRHQPHPWRSAATDHGNQQADTGGKKRRSDVHG